MTHRITPPTELVQEWGHDAILKHGPYKDEPEHWEYEQHIANCAAQWGADQELEACCEYLEKGPYGFSIAACQVTEQLRAARRPKPPSLKEQALEMLGNAWEGGHINNNAAQTIRRALEQLHD